MARGRYPGAVKLVVSVDKSDDPEVLRVAEEFVWAFGDKEVIRRPERLGLRRHVLSCGDLSREHGSVVVLEDDLYVSPEFYAYAGQALAFYRGRSEIAGISLYAHHLNVHARLRFEPLPDESDVFFLQMASSWGQAWTWEQWRGFRDWYGGHDGPVTAEDNLPDAMVGWPDSSWLKYYTKYMVATGNYFVYPRESLSTNCGDRGVHHRSGTTLFQVPLQLFKSSFRFKPLADSAAVYDAWFELLPSRLDRLTDSLKGYDYSVDLYGTKAPGRLGTAHVLTSRRCRSHVRSFGRTMRPPEMNVIAGVPGQDILLSAVGEVVGAADGQLPQFYPELSSRRLLAMVRARLAGRLGLTKRT